MIATARFYQDYKLQRGYRFSFYFSLLFKTLTMTLLYIAVIILIDVLDR